MLFNEPKLLKLCRDRGRYVRRVSFSALQRAEIAETRRCGVVTLLLDQVSVLFNEPKLLKQTRRGTVYEFETCFSALQRAEIAETQRGCNNRR